MSTSGSVDLGATFGAGAGGGVTSLNTQTGALTLLPGTGIAITPGSGTLTISTMGTGTVTNVSVVSANGLAGSVANPTTTPAITLSTTITGILQGNGTAISAATTGNLTDTGTDGIVVTGGTGAVLGSGTSIAQQVADSTHNGYLNSTDWSTFNNKQAAGNYITALTGDVTASGPGSVAATIANNAVTNAKLAQMPTLTLKGNNIGGTANALDLTVSQVNTMLGAITSIGTFNNTSTANGLDITSSVLTLHAADGTNPGAVSTGTQTLAGAKTFTGNTLIAQSAGSVATIGLSGSTANQIINGGLIVTTRTITANLTIDTTSNDYLILCNNAGAINVTLPTPSNGRTLIIKDIAGTSNTHNITIVRNGSEMIEGIAASKILQTNYGTVTLVADGTNWWMI